MVDHKLPCDVQINHIKFRKGVSLSTLVEAATRWHTMAKEAHALPRTTRPAVDVRDYLMPRNVLMTIPDGPTGQAPASDAATRSNAERRDDL